MTMRSHVIDYRIHGDDLQFVEVELDPGETVIGEAGAMMFLESGIGFESKMGDGAEPDQGLWGRLKDAGKRAMAQESIFLNALHQRGSCQAGRRLLRRVPRHDLASQSGCSRRDHPGPERCISVRGPRHEDRHRLPPQPRNRTLRW